MMFASVALHLVLLVLFLLLPAHPPAVRAAEDLEVRFDLTEPPSSELFQPSDPVEDRPTEEPVDPAPSALGEDVPVLPDPAPAVPPVPAPIPNPREQPTPEVEPNEAEPQDAPEDTDAAEAAAEADDRGVQSGSTSLARFATTRRPPRRSSSRRNRNRPGRRRAWNSRTSSACRRPGSGWTAI